MDWTRRNILKWSSVGIVGGLAGCYSNSVSTPDPDPEPAQEPENNQTPENDDLDRNFGELGNTAVFREGEGGRIQVTPTQAWLQDAIVWANSGIISSYTPQDSEHAFLFVEVNLENTGSEEMFVPRQVTVTMDGGQYDITSHTGLPGGSYLQFDELQPGSSGTGIALFSLPPIDQQAQLIFQSASFGDEPTARWDIDLSELDHETFDYSGLEVGETIEFGVQDTRYALSLRDWEVNDGYTYQSGEYEFEHNPNDGNKFLLASIRSENVGDTAVSIPGPFSFSLISGNSQIDAGSYQGDSDRYSGGEISTGIVREGYVLFEVPESASEYQLQVDLTQNITASWPISE